MDDLGVPPFQDNPIYPHEMLGSIPIFCGVKYGKIPCSMLQGFRTSPDKLPPWPRIWRSNGMNYKISDIGYYTPERWNNKTVENGYI